MEAADSFETAVSIFKLEEWWRQQVLPKRLSPYSNYKSDGSRFFRNGCLHIQTRRMMETAGSSEMAVSIFELEEWWRQQVLPKRLSPYSNYKNDGGSRFLRNGSQHIQTRRVM